MTTNVNLSRPAKTQIQIYNIKEFVSNTQQVNNLKMEFINEIGLILDDIQCSAYVNGPLKLRHVLPAPNKMPYSQFVTIYPHPRHLSTIIMTTCT